MKKVAFYVNMPSPYRVEFFNQLGKHCQLYVFFEMDKSRTRNDAWQSYNFEYFNAIFLKGVSYSGEAAFCPNIIKEYKKIKPDINIVCNYSSLTGIRLVNYFINHKIDYSIEGDGAFDRKDNFIKHAIKTNFIKNASFLFYTSDEHKNYLVSHGAKESQLIRYPFSSILEEDIITKIPTKKEKDELKASLNIKTKPTILTVGRFLKFKNFEMLIEAQKDFDDDAQLFIIGGEPTESYTELISKLRIKNITFLPFMSKEELHKYYLASDLFVFTSLCDVWGLVVNEAMANALPVICSDGALSGIELAKGNEGVKIYSKDSISELKELISSFLTLSEEEKLKLGEMNIKKIHDYTIEKMCESHVNFYLTKK